MDVKCSLSIETNKLLPSGELLAEIITNCSPSDELLAEIKLPTI